MDSRQEKKRDCGQAARKFTWDVKKGKRVRAGIVPVSGCDIMEAGMDKGRIIFLNGVTSAGKTSIVEALQERDDIFFYVVANDLFQEMIGDKYLRENYWKYLSEVIIMMYHTAKLYSDMGKIFLLTVYWLKEKK